MEEVKELLIALIPSISSVLAMVLTAIGVIIKVKHLKSDNLIATETLRKHINTVINENHELVTANASMQQIIAKLQEDNNQYKEFIKDTVVDLNEMIEKLEDDIKVCDDLKKEIVRVKRDIKVVLNDVNKN